MDPMEFLYTHARGCFTIVENQLRVDAVLTGCRVDRHSTVLQIPENSLCMRGIGDL